MAKLVLDSNFFCPILFMTDIQAKNVKRIIYFLCWKTFARYTCKINYIGMQHNQIAYQFIRDPIDSPTAR